MEKLINLLNEYEEYKEKETEIRNYTRRHVKYNDYERIECLREVDGELFGEEEWTAIIICKGYMFIQRLMEQWKVNRWIPNQLIKDIETREMWNYLRLRRVDYYWTIESLLMFLSIQDDPIKFLISILR